MGILIISSEIDELVRTCDRVLGVYEGSIVHEWVGDEITAAALGSGIVDVDQGTGRYEDESPSKTLAIVNVDEGISRPGDESANAKAMTLTASEQVVATAARLTYQRDRRRAQNRPFAAVLRSRELALVGVMAILLLAVGLKQPSFLSLGNIDFILVNSVVLGLVALGETFVLLGKGIDLSVAPIVGLTAAVTGILANTHGLSLYAAIGIAIAIGAFLGLINGLIIALLGVPPIIVTLGTLFVYSGLVFLYLNGQEVYQVPSSYARFGGGLVLPGVPFQVVLLAVCGAVCWVIVGHTVYGRNIMSVGGSSVAARNAGIPVDLITASTYIVSGALAGFAGLVYVCYTGFAVATTGTGTDIELTAIAAALIGGTSFAGGRGNPVGSILGSVFLSMALSATVALHVAAIWDPAGQGMLIIIVVGLDAALVRRAQRIRALAR
jgi:ribose/xylose/arabinose/galactoside ABC-type transport system permease subunit